VVGRSFQSSKPKVFTVIVSNMEKRLKVDADIRKNRLYFIIAGLVRKDALERLYTETRFCVADLKPGFDVITDLTACDLGHLDGLPTFRKIMYYLVSHGVREVVRIMNPDSLFHHQIINFDTQVAGYKSFWVSSRQEAEEFLDQSVRRDNIRFTLPKTKIAIQIREREVICSLFDISITGCSIVTNLSPSVDSEIIVKLRLPRSGGATSSFDIASKIVRVMDNNLAVVFTSLNNDDRTRLRECLKDIMQS